MKYSIAGYTAVNIKLEIMTPPISGYHSLLKSLYLPVKKLLRYAKSAFINKYMHPVLKKENPKTASLIILVSLDKDAMPMNLIREVIMVLAT